MTWIDLLTNPEPIRSVYGDEVPTLDNISVFDITLDRNSAKLNLRFDLENFPSRPPKKWRESANNTVQLTLSFIPACDVKIEGWNVSPVGSLSMDRLPSGRILVNLGPNPKLSLTSEFVTLKKMTAYIDSEKLQ